MGRDEDLRREASDWLTRMRGPDAEAVRPAFEAWLAADPDHRATYERIGRGFETTRFTRNLDIVRDRNLDRAGSWYRQSGLRTAALAGIAVLLAGGLVALLSGGLGTPTARAVAYETTIGQLRTVALADSTRFVLDARSTVSVDADSARLLTGRARFTVAGRSTPFAVNANGLMVSASDCDFDVELTAHAVRVTSWRGEARVQPAATTRPAAFVTLRAGQQFSTDAPSPAPSGSGGTDWRKGMLSFDGERLDDAIATFNRYNRLQLVLADPASGALKITGAFHADDPRGFAGAVAAMFKLIVDDRGGDTLYLRPSKKT